MRRSLVALVAVALVVSAGRAHAQQTIGAERLRIFDDSLLSGDVGHPDYLSQLTRWNITPEGGADFRYLFTDELHARSFVADLEQALAGSQIIAKSVAMLASNFTVPAASTANTITVRDLPSAENMAVFESGDTIRLRSFSRASGSLTVADAYGVVTSYADQPGGVQQWTFTRNAGANAGTMTDGTIIQVDALVLDYGVSGNGFHEINAIDGVYGINSPYSQTVTWTGAPIAANLTVRTRIGNLRGITGTSGEYGAIFGTYAATNGQYVRVSNQAVELHGVNLQMWSGATNVIKLDRTAPSFAIGSPVPADYSTGTGIWMGNDGGTYKFRVGNPAGNRVTWDGSTLNVVGAVTATTGVIGGWTIGASSLSSGSGSTFVALDSGGTNPAIYAGSSTPGTAPFRVTNAGALTATAGVIGGWSIESDRLSSPTSTAVIEAQGVISLGSGNSVVRLSSVNASYRLWVGNENPASAPFRVSTTGGFVATNADITGSLEAGSGNVSINSSGIEIQSGSSDTNKVRWSDGSYLRSNSDALVIRGDSLVTLNAGGTTLTLASSSRLNISQLSGSGDDYVCVDSSGGLFRSNAAC